MNVVCCLISKLVLIISFKVQTKSLTISKIKLLSSHSNLSENTWWFVIKKYCATVHYYKVNWQVTEKHFQINKNLIKRRHSEWRVAIIFFFKKGNSERYLIRCECGINRSTLYHATILLQLKHDVSWSKQTPRRS